MINTVTIAGRLTKDPSFGKTATKGTHYANFSLANERGFGERKKTNFFEVSVWGNAAERMEKAKVSKGSFIYLAGSLDQQQYEYNGEKRTAIKIIVGDSGEWGYISSSKKADETAPSSGASSTANTTSTVPEFSPEDGFMTVPDDDQLPF